MKHQNLPHDDSVVRVVPPGKLRRDEANNIVGIEHTAFIRREDEDGLSVTWLEYFAGDRTQQIHSAVHALRASSYKPGKNAGFAIGKVGAIHAACEENDCKVRIIHWPEDDNKAHSEIRQLPRDNLVLLERLAASACAELVMNRSIPDGACTAPDTPAQRE